MRKKLLGVLIGFLVLATAGVCQASGAKITVTVKNLTHATWFTPLLITAHDRNTDLFELGEAASPELQAMAEVGDISGLVALVGGEDDDTVANPARGPLAPGSAVSAELRPERFRNRYLSIVAMLLPTNDGFVGLDSLRIPRIPGVYTYYLNGYDAGTEANDEVFNEEQEVDEPGIPADPSGYAGDGASGVVNFDANTTVHIHRNIIGDDDPMGGSSDLDRAVHRWLNPVAEVIIEVHPGHRRWR